MLLVQNNNTNPFFNLASEEYLLKEFSEDYLMFYINDPSVIVGKHQNTLSEISYHFVRENNIHVARRLSGGGAVYHDHGNLNFSFICNGQEEKMINFKKYTQPIIEALNNLGVSAQHSGQSDISIDGLKISGNAEHVYKKRVLHHGTLLFSSKLSFLSNALKSNAIAYTDQSVKSVKSPVTTINKYLTNSLEIESFKEYIFNSIKKTNGLFDLFNFSETDNEKIKKLTKEKYETWEWNYGYSPDYIFNTTIVLSEGKSSVHLEVKKGIIYKALISGYLSKTTNALQGRRHEFRSIKKSLSDEGFNNDFIEKLIEQLF
jgi:lipoate---protein ligase